MKATSTLTCLLTGAALLIGPSAFAGDPQPTPVPKVQKKSTAKTLADLAGSIKLGAKDKDDKAGVVIDNNNLKKMGEGAVISQGGTLASSPSRASSGGEKNSAGEMGAETPHKKNKDVELLEAKLEAVKKAEKENKRANMYNGAGPQYRTPGTRDPLEIQREKLEAKLKEAKANSQTSSDNTSQRRPRTR